MPPYHWVPLRSLSPDTGSPAEDEIADAPYFEVGYGKPPTASRFKPGQSGNPKGRKKGVRNIKTFFREELDRRQWITVDGKRRLLSKREIAVLQQIARAHKGDPKAFRAIMEQDEALATETASQAKRTDISVDEHKILADHLAYLRKKG